MHQQFLISIPYILDIRKLEIISLLILLEVILEEEIYLPIYLKENIS